jgi:Fe-S-cluster containining protein
LANKKLRPKKTGAWPLEAYLKEPRLVIDPARSAAQDLWAELTEARETLPTTNCSRRTDCCALLPPMGLIEALRLMADFDGMTDDRRQALILKCVEYFFLNPVRIMGCPFLEGIDCLVYANRPFGCRAYGLWSPSFYRRRQESAARSKKAVVRAWTSLGVTLPRAVADHRPRYCREVKTVSGPAPDDAAIEAVNLRIQTLDESLGHSSRVFAQTYASDLSFLLTADLLGFEAALQHKVTVVREYLDRGESAGLAYLLDRAARRIRRPS